MTRSYFSFSITVAGFGAACLIFAGFGASADPIRDVGAIQGTWRQVSGKDSRGATKSGFQGLVIDGDRYAILPEKREQESIIAAREVGGVFEIDRSSDLGTPSGAKRVVLLDRGIFKLDGNRLRLCFSGSRDLPRPSRIESTPENKAALLTLERIGPVPAEERPLARRLDGEWHLVGTKFGGVDGPLPKPAEFKVRIDGSSWLEIKTPVYRGGSSSIRTRPGSSSSPCRTRRTSSGVC